MHSAWAQGHHWSGFLIQKYPCIHETLEKNEYTNSIIIWKNTIDYLESWPHDINTFNYGTQWKCRVLYKITTWRKWPVKEEAMGKTKICESQIVTTKEQKYPKHSAKCIHPSMWYIYYVSAFCGKADAFENRRRKLFFDRVWLFKIFRKAISLKLYLRHS